MGWTRLGWTLLLTMAGLTAIGAAPRRAHAALAVCDGERGNCTLSNDNGTSEYQCECYALPDFLEGDAGDAWADLSPVELALACPDIVDQLCPELPPPDPSAACQNGDQVCAVYGGAQGAIECHCGKEDSYWVGVGDEFIDFDVPALEGECLAALESFCNGAGGSETGGDEGMGPTTDPTATESGEGGMMDAGEGTAGDSNTTVDPGEDDGGESTAGDTDTEGASTSGSPPDPTTSTDAGETANDTTSTDTSGSDTTSSGSSTTDGGGGEVDGGEESGKGNETTTPFGGGGCSCTTDDGPHARGAWLGLLGLVAWRRTSARRRVRGHRAAAR